VVASRGVTERRAGRLERLAGALNHKGHYECMEAYCTDLAIKCATHSGSTVGRKIRSPAYPRPMPMGFHAFHKPDSPPSQIRLCVAGFMTRFVLHDIQVEARARDKKERGQRLFGLSLFSVSPYAREVPSTVNSGQVRLTCRDDEGCAPLPGRSLPQCKNLPMVHPDPGIAETA
jgi:hypothetical protein